MNKLLVVSLQAVDRIHHAIYNALESLLNCNKFLVLTFLFTTSCAKAWDQSGASLQNSEMLYFL